MLVRSQAAPARPYTLRVVPFLGLQFVGQDRNEDQVVDDYHRVNLAPLRTSAAELKAAVESEAGE